MKFNTVNSKVVTITLSIIMWTFTWQRKLVAKDFNIAKEAGGVGKAVIKNFTAVVTSNALEIRLYWAGKGTTTIPFGSVYGPLISAISVDPG